MKFIITVILWFQMSLLTSTTIENSGYKVYTAMRKGFQGAVRDFQVVSQWTPSRPVSAEIFPNMFFGLNARHFLVATLAVSFILRINVYGSRFMNLRSNCLHAKESYVPAIDMDPLFREPLCSFCVKNRSATRKNLH